MYVDTHQKEKVRMEGADGFSICTIRWVREEVEQTL